MSGFLVCMGHPNEAFTSECPACMKLQNENLKNLLSTICDAVDAYVTEIGEKEIGADVVKVFRTRMAEARKVLKLDKVQG